MNGTTSAAFRNGSSERYSKLRPLIGERAMLTPGPSRKLTLRARASRPRPSPSLRARSVSQLAASAHAAGIGRGRSPGAHADRSIGHLEARQVDGGHGAREHVVDAAKQLDLLLQRELGDHGVGLGFNGGRIGRRRLGRNGEAGCKKNCGNERERREKGVQPK